VGDGVVNPGDDKPKTNAKVRWRKAAPTAVSAPPDIKAILARGRELRDAGRFAEARRLLDPLVRAAPSSAALWIEWGLVAKGLGDAEGAVAAYRRAVEIDPAKGDTLYQLGAMLLDRRRPREGEAVADRLLALEPDKPRSWALKGLMLRAAGRLEEAVPWFEKAVDRTPGDFLTLNALMMALHGLGRTEEARARGLAALVHKDRRARTEFKASPDGALALNRRPAPFDPARPQRNVIAFSLWGDHPDYTHGAIVNAQIAPHVYRGWTCRFYCDDTVPRPILEELRRLKAQVIRMPERNAVASGAFWRFLASDDSEVDRFLCRDADSRVNCRERAAVEAWLASGKSFHAMRDHVYHNELILAGMWGGIAGVLPNIDRLSRRHGRYSGVRHADQNFLRAVVWPLVHDDILVHDSQYRFAGSQDFPPFSSLPGNLHVGWGERNMLPWTPR
jgi:Flp pilus assembly protein TadD